MDKHRGAFEYDWRTRFALSLHKVGTRAMTWGEAHRLALVLVTDPSSQVFTALAKWEHPVTREWMVLAEHRDSTELGRVGRRAKLYPRPWPDRTTRRIGGTRSYAPDELAVVLTAVRQRKVVTGDG